jgi:DNA-binding NarL/FixJ family response regulator
VIRVLVVDDSVSFLAAATEVIVAAEGFELAGVAQGGAEGLELARISRPDLALIDLNMPGLDGHETAARMATQSPETIAVVMTAILDSANRTNGIFDKRRLSPATLTEIWNQVQTPIGSEI